jgi:hypothetical protein
MWMGLNIFKILAKQDTLLYSEKYGKSPIVLMCNLQGWDVFRFQSLSASLFQK